MCGIVGVIAKAPVNQLLYDALLLLQHRGQDAAGIVTMMGTKCFMHKARGMVRDVFRTRNMRGLPGQVGLGQVRYPTAGNAYSEEEAQPFYVNAPFGIVLVHNGNLTNAHTLKQELFDVDRRHINTESDTEVLINVVAHELEVAARDLALTPEAIFKAVGVVHKRVKGSYAVIALIAGHGLLAFRDPFGIRPLCFGEGQGPEGREVMVASESVALEGTGHKLVRDVAPGEAIFIDMEGRIHAQQCAEHPTLNPCMFEFVYLARPDSVMDGISVYQARLNLGETLAQRVISTMPPSQIDVVIPRDRRHRLFEAADLRHRDARHRGACTVEDELEPESARWPPANHTEGIKTGSEHPEAHDDWSRSNGPIRTLHVERTVRRRAASLLSRPLVSRGQGLRETAAPHEQYGEDYARSALHHQELPRLRAVGGAAARPCAARR